jgi:CheY-like chemotaxis protein
MAETGRDISTGMPGRRSRFLLAVDGDVNDLFYISMLLQRFEYNISTATSAAEAMKLTTIAVPSLVIASLALADIPGLEFVRRFKQDPRTAGVPVLVKTADRTPAMEQRCRQNGAAACIYEPVRAEDLYQAVQAAIEPTPRKNIRITTMLPISVNGKPLDCVEGECASVLSEHGMYVRTLRPSAVNTRLSLQIVIKDRTVAVEAVVLYCHRFGEGPFKEPGMGLKFVSITPKDQELIQLFIREQLTRGMPA